MQFIPGKYRISFGVENMSITLSKLGMAILPSWLGPGDLTVC